MLVAIDGPAGAGKSTIARELARDLGCSYLDSGAMYRCVGLLSLRAPDADPAALARAAQIALDDERVTLDGHDVSAEIRTPEVSSAASRVAALAGVREALVAKQRALAASGDWVVEGRDIGTVVAPDAELKVFLTASADARARRRALQTGADPAAVLADQERRDARDATRAHSPLVPARDAVVLDTTGLSVAEAVATIAALARAAAARR
jgi:cytidylate kinase